MIGKGNERPGVGEDAVVGVVGVVAVGFDEYSENDLSILISSRMSYKLLD